MFIELLDSAREIRSPLAAGYGALAALWIIFGEWVATSVASDPLGMRLTKGFNGLGAATTFALVTFLAAMLGSVIWHLFLKRAVRKLHKILKHPDWKRWIEVAEKAVDRHEAFDVGDFARMIVNSPQSLDIAAGDYLLPSRHHGERLQAEVEDRKRRQSEIEFRTVLAFVGSVVSISLIIEGGVPWLPTLIVPVFVFAEVWMLKNTTKDIVIAYELQEVIDTIIQLKKTQERTKDPERRKQIALSLDSANSQRQLLNASLVEVGAKMSRKIRG